MPFIGLPHNEAIPHTLCSVSISKTISIPPRFLLDKALDHVKSVLPGEQHKLRRRDTSSGIVGIVVGLTILVTIIGAVLFIWNWNHFKQAKVQKDQKQYKKGHHSPDHSQTRPRHHHHSHRRQRTVAHLTDDLENQENVEFEHEQQDQHIHFKHHPNCRHQRLHHRKDPVGSWTPQQPKPAAHPWSRRQQVHIPNRMDAPQIHGEWKRPSFFEQRGDKRDGSTCV